MDEHRAAPRRRLLKAGKIMFGGGAVIDCTVRNLSETGAALEVISPVGIPERWPSKPTTAISRATWYGERRAGSGFTSRRDLEAFTAPLKRPP